jgi:hypothetical protein
MIRFVVFASLALGVVGCGDGGVRKTCDKLARLGAEYRQREIEKLPPAEREPAQKSADAVGESASAECAASKRTQRSQIGETAWKAYVSCVEAAKTSEDAGRCDKP